MKGLDCGLEDQGQNGGGGFSLQRMLPFLYFLNCLALRYQIGVLHVSSLDRVSREKTGLLSVQEMVTGPETSEIMNAPFVW